MASKNVINMIVDGLAFAGFLFLASTGAILHYLLTPGSGRSYSLWGMSRHEWGDVHFFISVALLAVLALHVILHGGWIFAMLKGKSSEHSGGRLMLGVVGLAILIVVAVAPLVSPVEESARNSGDRRQDSQGH